MSRNQQTQPHSNENTVYPNIHAHIKLMLTVICITASLERSVSRLRLLRIHLQNHCGEECLSVIALLILHCDVEVNYKELV